MKYLFSAHGWKLSLSVYIVAYIFFMITFILISLVFFYSPGKSTFTSNLNLVSSCGWVTTPDCFGKHCVSGWHYTP